MTSGCMGNETGLLPHSGAVRGIASVRGRPDGGTVPTVGLVKIQGIVDCSILGFYKTPVDQFADQFGDLLRGFFKAVVDPGTDQLGRCAGMILCVVAVAPYAKTLDLPSAMLPDGLFQKIKKPSVLQQGQSLPLSPKTGAKG